VVSEQQISVPYCAVHPALCQLLESRHGLSRSHLIILICLLSFQQYYKYNKCKRRTEDEMCFPYHHNRIEMYRSDPTVLLYLKNGVIREEGTQSVL
jgi:hypothetical protein